MKQTQQEQATRNIVQQLDLDAENISPELNARLSQARREALQQAEAKTASRWFFSSTAYRPAAVLAMVLVAVLLVVDYQPQQQVDGFSPETFELVAANPDFELMQEELEFYLWLEESTEAG